jgi:hypothetical protein
MPDVSKAAWMVLCEWMSNHRASLSSSWTAQADGRNHTGQGIRGGPEIQGGSVLDREGARSTREATGSTFRFQLLVEAVKDPDKGHIGNDLERHRMGKSAFAFNKA